MSKIAFLGAGRMASAMVGGILGQGTRPADLACTSGPDDTARQLSARTGIAAQDDLEKLLAGVDAVVLACKPQQLASLDSRLAELTAGKLVLSILAGKRLASLAQKFPKARNLVRAMPNTPGQIGAGVVGWSPLQPISTGDRQSVDLILGSLGKMVALREDQLDAVTGLSGSGPAYVFELPPRSAKPASPSASIAKRPSCSPTKPCSVRPNSLSKAPTKPKNFETRSHRQTAPLTPA